MFDQVYTIYRRVRVTNKITKGIFIGYVPEKEILHRREVGAWRQTQHLPMDEIRNIIFSEAFLDEAPNLKRSIERFGKENFDVCSWETETYGSIDEIEESNSQLVERILERYSYPCYNLEDMEEEVDWGALIANAKRLKEEEKKANARAAHRPTESITIKNLETGEERTFDTKTDCMEYLHTSSATFARFLKGNSKLNKLFQIC